MIYTKGQDAFDVFPDKINYFGDIYTKRYWVHDRDVVTYTLNQEITNAATYDF